MAILTRFCCHVISCALARRGATEANSSGAVQRVRKCNVVGLTSILDRGVFLAVEQNSIEIDALFPAVMLSLVNT